MTQVVIYHNPRCSKSRATLQLLRDHGIEPSIVAYLETPPTEAELCSLLRALNLSPTDLLRRDEAAYRELGLDGVAVTDDARIAALLTHPELLQRPIVVKGNVAVLGRPPENVLRLLEPARA